MIEPLLYCDFELPGQVDFYRGKVRDVFRLKDGRLVMVTTDRLSAFDVVMPWGIRGKGAILNLMATRFLDYTSDIVPNWKIASPHPMVTVGRWCDSLPVEVVVRGYLSGHAWREYRSGKRELCGVRLPEGLEENERLPEPIITPTTKAHAGHDEDISREEIIGSGLVDRAVYEQVERYALALFARGSEIAYDRNLVLVDTKYEFGMYDGEVMLIDEIHTPDSSRYFYADSSRRYAGWLAGKRRGEAVGAAEPLRQLSKEFVREWLMDECGFSGRDGEEPPAVLPAGKGEEISDRYAELYETILGERFEWSALEVGDFGGSIRGAIGAWLAENPAQ